MRLKIAVSVVRSRPWAPSAFQADAAKAKSPEQTPVTTRLPQTADSAARRVKRHHQDVQNADQHCQQAAAWHSGFSEHPSLHIDRDRKGGVQQFRAFRCQHYALGRGIAAATNRTLSALCSSANTTFDTCMAWMSPARASSARFGISP
jgi:hypothetical protein